jgi:uncharacterized membrane protein YphA (DoxX/SURF4 family)
MSIRRSHPLWITLLRIAVGFSWLVTGFQKVMNPSYSLTFHSMIEHWAIGSSGGIHAFLISTVLPSADALSFALKALELLIGLSLVLGLIAPLGAFGGFAIIAAAWVFKQSFESAGGYVDGNFIVMVTMLFLVLTSPGRYFGLDAFFFRRREEGPIIVGTGPTVGSTG